MSDTKTTSSAAGCTSSVGFILFLTFLILKLCHVIDWSWWWITAPLWISAGLAIIVLIFILGIALVSK